MQAGNTLVWQPEAGFPPAVVLQAGLIQLKILLNSWRCRPVTIVPLAIP
jgi:hypothetical protein